MLSTLRNLAARRELVGVLVRSELQTQAAGTYLGWLWWMLDPLFTMLVYVFVFSVIFPASNQYSPFSLFILCGLLPWKHLATSLSTSAEILRSREYLLSSVAFPTMVLPLATVLSRLVYLVLGMVVLVGAAFSFGRPMTWALVQLVPLLVLQHLVVTGLSLGVACIGVLVRDLSPLLEHVLRFGVYGSPIIYGLDLVREQMGDTASTLYMLNPMALVITGIRDAVFYGKMMEWQYWAMLSVEAAVILPVGYLIYRRYDGKLIKYV